MQTVCYLLRTNGQKRIPNKMPDKDFKALINDFMSP